MRLNGNDDNKKRWGEFKVVYLMDKSRNRLHLR